MVRWENESYHPVVIFPEEPKVLDLTGSQDYGIEDSIWTIGRYDEVRSIYTTELFSDGRTIHVGLDLGGPIGTPVYSFFNGEIYASGFNPLPGDYGHTIVTQHRIDGHDVWALFGHLDSKSTTVWRAGDKIETGQLIGRFGSKDENGGWPPHVHVQLSLIKPEGHDLPGVVHPKDRDWALSVFPDPRLILGPLY
jgi:murein DD-endopeptidase MepM/ murein hydrolase activator NlpD